MLFIFTFTVIKHSLCETVRGLTIGMHDNDNGTDNFRPDIGKNDVTQISLIMIFFADK